MGPLDGLRDVLSEVLHSRCEALGVAGAVIGAAVGGEEVTVAHGVANLNTGQQFTTDTGWLLGSVTKVLTATMLLRLVDRGLVDLEFPITKYLPDFDLREAGTADQITVRMLLNHSSGIDADALMPSDHRGHDATRSYVERLTRFGTLFEPGCGVHYSNPGFVLAARIVEQLTGHAFERAIRDEVLGPAAMNDATAVQTEAFLRRTAVGAFSDPAGNAPRATRMFSLPESGAGAGATPIVTVSDMIAFGRMHLAKGVGQNSQRVLPAVLVKAMQTPTIDLNTPAIPPVGLGWWLMKIAGTTALFHGGGSPGGVSSFCVLPEYDAVIVSFATGVPGCALLNDVLHIAAIEHITGRAVEPPFQSTTPSPLDVDVDVDVDGDYAAFQICHSVKSQDSALVVSTRFDYIDDDHEEWMTKYSGGADRRQARAARYRPVAQGLYAPEHLDGTALAGFYGQGNLLAVLPSAPGRAAGIHSGLRFAPKVTQR